MPYGIVVGGVSLKEKVIVEICVDSIQSALAAENGGAGRIELCQNLMVGGTTPSIGLIQLAKEYLNIDINIMIRPRSGDFCYSSYEIEVMKRDIQIAKDYNVNGIVTGVLKPNGEIDINIMEELIQLARPLNVTFHRAFDMTNDPFKSLDLLIALGVERVLTSGQENTAVEGKKLIKNLVDKSKDKIIIMPGAGVNEYNIRDIIYDTGIKEIHLSAKKAADSIMEYRNNKINMGSKLMISEYENYYTCEKTVSRITQILNNLEGEHNELHSMF